MKEDFLNLDKLSVPWWFNTSDGTRVQFHGFSDASQLAILAVVYLTVDSTSTIKNTTLVISKTKVAPLKRLTIPRLELSGALLFAKLVHHVKKTAGLDIEATYLWTDSQVALTWIKAHPSRWKDYVRNRVTQIQELTQDCSWMHVPGTCNPADCASRGMTTAQLASHDLWWKGPSWLTQNRGKWPKQTNEFDEACNLEPRPGLSLVGIIPEPDCQWELLYRYSSLFKLLRVTALCFRLFEKLRRRPDTPSGTVITPFEPRRAQQYWVKATQATTFSSELRALSKGSSLLSNHPLSRLTSSIVADGILRVGGRLALSALDEEEKHPAIRPRHARLTSLVIDEAHRKTLHGGTQLTLAYIRQRYWIFGGRAQVNAHVYRCVICARQRGIGANQLMGQLPLCRVTPSRPFTHTGVDYAGPITLKTWQGRGVKMHKGWICVFVCLATSAVHLDVITDYSADTFLAAFRRFVSRRGIPTSMYSDRGTTFLGAETSLKQMFTEHAREHPIVAAELSKEGIGWIFNPPAAPHMGGKWEAAVKSIKHHLRTFGESMLTFEQFSTLLTQIEAILNSRPLEPLSDDSEDVTALTPGHFLVGTALTSVPEPSLLDLSTSRVSQWQLLQQKVGSLILITDKRTPPCRWPLARVLQLYPGQDGLARVANLKTATTTLTRPIAKLCLLPTEDQQRNTG